MDGINARYNIKLEVLTPLHIGAGEENDLVEGVDFILKDRYMYRLDFTKVVNIIDAEKLSAILSSTDEDKGKRLLDLFGGRLESVSTQRVRMPFSSSNNFKSFIKNQLSNNPVIPGSSIKGALRSVIYGYLNTQKSRGLKEEELFGSPTKGDELLRFLKVSDFECSSQTSFINTKIFNLIKENNNWVGAWKNSGKNNDKSINLKSFNTVCESLLPCTICYGSIMFTPDLFEKAVSVDRYGNKDKKRHVLDINSLFDEVNINTKEFLKKEKKFFNKYFCNNTPDECNAIIENINYLLDSIPKDNSSAILRMSFGSGFNSITGDWQFDDYTKDRILGRKDNKDGLPKSRKIAIYDDEKEDRHFNLMGFVKLSVVDDEEFNEYKNALFSSLAEKREKYLLSGIKHKYDSLVSNADKSLKEKDYQTAAKFLREAVELNYDDGTAEAKLNKINRFIQCLDNSRSMSMEGNLEPALAELEEAKEMNINNDDVEERINCLKVKIGVCKFEDLLKQVDRYLTDGDYHKATESLDSAKVLYNRELLNIQGVTESIMEREIKINEAKITVKIGLGLSFLSAKKDNGNYIVTDYKGGKNRITQWLKKSNSERIPLTEEEKLFDFLARIYQSVNKREMKDWESLTSKVWNDIKRWCGDDRAAEFFNKIVGRK